MHVYGQHVCNVNPPCAFCSTSTAVLMLYCSVIHCSVIQLDVPTMVCTSLIGTCIRYMPLNKHSCFCMLHHIRQSLATLVANMGSLTCCLMQQAYFSHIMCAKLDNGNNTDTTTSTHNMLQLKLAVLAQTLSTVRMLTPKQAFAACSAYCAHKLINLFPEVLPTIHLYRHADHNALIPWI